MEPKYASKNKIDSNATTHKTSIFVPSTMASPGNKDLQQMYKSQIKQSNKDIMITKNSPKFKEHLKGSFNSNFDGLKLRLN